MKLTTVIASFIVMPMLLATITAANNYDHYLLSCGISSTDADVSSRDGRRWNSDNNSNFSTNFSSTIAASTITAIGVDPTPFSSARIFTSNFTYSFPVSPGPKFIRLFFYPSASPSTPYKSSSTAQSFNTTYAYLSVQANTGHILLRNFSAYFSVNSSSDHVQKEFYVHVIGSPLRLTFYPTLPNTYAFVNGIEVVSIPQNLYIGSTPPIDVDDKEAAIELEESMALETAYRLNVGGSDVNPNSDNGNMFRYWLNDEPYLSGFQGSPGLNDNQTATNYMTNYSAPATVYQSYRLLGLLIPNGDLRRKLNVTWAFQVDLGFRYLVRLHWCEVVLDINASNYRIFDVYIDKMKAQDEFDVYGEYGREAVFKDYVVSMDDGNQSDSRGFLQLAMMPNTNTDPKYTDILLNGVEIFKINRLDGSLDAPNPSRPLIDQKPLQPRKSAFHVVPIIIGVLAGVILLAVLICCLIIFRRRKWSKTSAGSSGTNSTKSKLLFSFGKSTATTKRSSGGGGSSLPSDLCRHFSLSEIRLATSDFIPSLIIGHGGFGNVYKGTVNTESGPTTVAIKRLNPLSGQGAREFTTEIELLSKLRHVHLVSLIGYCDDGGEMILVYEFMSRGTLREHLYPNITGQMMPWCQRLQACVGAARGLHYLHTGTERMIIHRDVKSTNILVDESWVAKVSDFGLSKLGPVGGELSHVSTHVKGSFGYVDPEYYRRQQLTEKSDVYSFGVVLFEVLCGRAAVNPNLPKEQVNLRIWARKNQLSGTLDTIVDPNLKGQIAPECLRKFGEVAESCVRDEGANRPSMVDVIWGLEFALQLQLESAANTTVNGDYKTDTVYDENVATTNMGSPITDTSARLIRFSEENSNWSSINNSSSGLFSNTTLQGGDGGSTDVFSQIFKPEGR